MDRFEFELTDLRIDLDERLFQTMDPVGGLIQRTFAVGHGKPQASRCLSRQLSAQFSLDRLHLGQEARGLSMESQHVDFAVDPFGDRHDRFIDGAAGEREFFLKAAQKFQRHRAWG